jgi:hypothetical protein
MSNVSRKIPSSSSLITAMKPNTKHLFHAAAISCFKIHTQIPKQKVHIFFPGTFTIAYIL